jgi:hypothetical protein
VNEAVTNRWWLRGKVYGGVWSGGFITERSVGGAVILTTDE